MLPSLWDLGQGGTASVEVGCFLHCPESHLQSIQGLNF
jgi:hypothetical protein